MRRLTLLCTVYCFLLTSLHAQVSLPYYSGFDNTAERDGWTIYRLGESAIGNWGIASIGGFSPTSCVSHDYSPSSGVNVVDDWYVSPGFLIPSGGTLDSVRYAFSGFSVPSIGDTIGVYLIIGDQDPDAASDIIELAEFRDAEYQADNVYRLLSGITLPATDEMSFIGLRYRNAEASSRWLHVKFDNVAVSATTTSVNDPAQLNLLNVYPNPTIDKVTIVHKETGGIVYLYDQSGLCLQKYVLDKGQLSTTISLHEWPQGNYRFVMEQGDNLENVSIMKM